CAGMLGGGLWIMLAGGLRQYRGVNETISSLLLVYIALAILNHLVEGMMRDPTSLNKPSTREIGAAKLIMTICFLAGAPAGLAGMVEVAAVQGRTNANLAAGYGFTGILVAFLARQNPLAVIPVAILLGGIGASGGLLQRRLGLPD